MNIRTTIPSPSRTYVSIAIWCGFSAISAPRDPLLLRLGCATCSTQSAQNPAVKGLRAVGQALLAPSGAGAQDGHAVAALPRLSRRHLEIALTHARHLRSWPLRAHGSGRCRW